MIRSVSGVMMALLAGWPAAAADPPSACAASPRLVGPCFSVHGRLAVWNGAPAFRIRPAGSKRMLGVNGAGGLPALEADLPPSVKAARPSDAAPLDGDYRVCPLSRERRGHMQFVCIDSASRLIARAR